VLLHLTASPFSLSTSLNAANYIQPYYDDDIDDDEQNIYTFL